MLYNNHSIKYQSSNSMHGEWWLTQFFCVVWPALLPFQYSTRAQSHGYSGCTKLQFKCIFHSMSYITEQSIAAIVVPVQYVVLNHFKTYEAIDLFETFEKSSVVQTAGAHVNQLSKHRRLRQPRYELTFIQFPPIRSWRCGKATQKLPQTVMIHHRTS